MDNKELAQIFKEIASILEIQGGNSFKVRTFVNAARTIDRTSSSISDLIEEILEGKVKGFGPSLQEQISEYKKYGSITYLQELRSEIPKDLLVMLKLPGLGVKKIKTLYLENNISTLEDLKERCKNGTLREIQGFGEKSEKDILESLIHLKATLDKLLLPEAESIASEVSTFIKKSAYCDKIEIVGELRRGCEIISSIDFLVSSPSNDLIFQHLKKALFLSKLSLNNYRISASYKKDNPINIFIVPNENFELGKLLFTGSKGHIEELKNLAKQKGLADSIIPNLNLLSKPLLNTPSTEPEIYKKLGLPWLPPELREDNYSLSNFASFNHNTLVKLKDIKGILHSHSTFSDGKNTIQQMAIVAKDLGYQYIGISDHSQTATYANGLKEETIYRQHKIIDSLNSELAPFKIFKGIESDILADGSLDYPKHILALFDFVIASIHSRFKMDKEAITQRIVKAIENPYTTILGHMTGRLLLGRKTYDLDIDRIFEAAKKHKVAIEINANPKRLDLDWRLHSKAKELGILLPICPDAHSTNGIYDIKYGVTIARKGSLTAQEIPNCWDVKKIEQFFINSRGINN